MQSALRVKVEARVGLGVSCMMSVPWSAFSPETRVMVFPSMAGGEG